MYVCMYDLAYGLLPLRSTHCLEAPLLPCEQSRMLNMQRQLKITDKVRKVILMPDVWREDGRFSIEVIKKVPEGKATYAYVYSHTLEQFIVATDPSCMKLAGVCFNGGQRRRFHRDLMWQI